MPATHIRRGVAMLAAAIVAVTLAACSPGDETSPDDGVLTIFAPQDANSALADNTFSKEMSELVGRPFEFETTTYDGAAAAEKRQISLASGDWPDLYLLVPWVDLFSQAELLKFGQQGVIVPLDDLIDEYAPNITAAFESNPDFEAFATAPDGNIWGMPQWNDCLHCTYHAKLWMNSEWLDTLGLDQPTTTDELFDVLMAFKTQDPNGNGRADEIPLTSSVADLLLPYFMNAFLYNPQGSDVSASTLALDGDRVTLQAGQDQWRDGLEYVATLYENGLIDDGAFTQNRDALKAKGDSADAVIVGAATMLHPWILASPGQDDERDRAYDAVPPVTGPDGVSYTSYNAPRSPGATFVLTKNASAEDRIAAIKILDHMFTDEGQIRGTFGIEGEQWEKPGAGDVALDETLEPLYKTIPADPDAPPANVSWGSMAQYNATAEFRGAQVQPTDIYDPAGYERRLFEASQPYADRVPADQVFPYWNLWPDESNASELAQLRTNIESAVSQWSLEFVTGARDVADDGQWDAYLKTLDDLGLPRYLEIMQEQYDA